MFKTILDARELAFLIRQIDEYIQVMEVIIRKTPALDDKELALARNLRKKLSAGKQARIWAKGHYQEVWLGGNSRSRKPNPGSKYSNVQRIRNLR